MSSAALRARIDELIRIVMHDGSSERSYDWYTMTWSDTAVSRAIGELWELLRDSDEARRTVALDRLRATIHDPAAPAGRVCDLLTGSGAVATPLLAALVQELRYERDPRLRSIYLTAAYGQARNLAVSYPNVARIDPVALYDGDLGVRLRAIWAEWYGHPAHPEDKELLIPLLDDPDFRVRMAAATRVPLGPAGAGLRALLRRVATETEPVIGDAMLIAVARVIAAEPGAVTDGAVADQIGSSSVDLLVRTLGHPSGIVRAAAAQALVELRRPEIAHAILDRLDREVDPRVRFWLLRYTGFAAAPERGLPLLVGLLERGDADQQAVAARRLGAFGPPAFGPLLDALARTPDDDEIGNANLRAAIATGLGQFAHAGVLPALVLVLGSARGAHHQQAIADALRAVARRPPPPDRWPERTLAALRELTDASPTEQGGPVLMRDLEFLAPGPGAAPDALADFAARLRVATHHSQLLGLLRPAPEGAGPCLRCRASGTTTGGYCPACSGRGWRRGE